MMNAKQRYILAALTGLLVALSFPLIIGEIRFQGLGIIAWVAFVPLFLAIRGVGARQSAILAFTSAMIYYASSIFWAGNALYVFGGYSIFATVPIVILMCVIVSVFAAFAVGMAVFISKRWRGELIVWLPVMWVAAELARNYVPCGGFPWSNIAMSQWRSIYAIQIADVGGVYSLMFIMIWTNAFISECILCRRATLQTLVPKAVVTALLIVMLFGYGYVRVNKISRQMANSPSIQVALIQGNIGQEEKWDERQAIHNLEVYRGLVASLKHKKLHAIIWPEASFPWSFETTVRSLNPAIFFSNGDAGLENPFTIFGALTEDPSGSFYNSAVMVDSRGVIRGRYDKVHLAPFGEYVPYKELLFFMEKLTKPSGDFLAGDGVRLLDAGGIMMGPLICYEEIFPQLAREETLLGADLLINLTNNAWFGKTSAPYHQLAMSVFRAVENRRYLLRGTNTGVSAVVAPTGKILIESALFERATIVTGVGVMDTITLYTRYGDWFAFGCAAYAIAGILLAIVAGRTKARNATA